MFAYDKNDNLNIVPSSEFEHLPFEENIEIDWRCPRCKKHNIITIK
jgi:rubredoxin